MLDTYSFSCLIQDGISLLFIKFYCAHNHSCHFLISESCFVRGIYALYIFFVDFGFRAVREDSFLKGLQSSLHLEVAALSRPVSFEPLGP